MRVLVVASRYPWPPRRGDQMLAIQLAGILGDRDGLGHDVIMLVPESATRRDAVPLELRFRIEMYSMRRRDALVGLLRAAIRGRPLQTGLYHQRDLGRRVRELARDVDLVIFQLTRLADYVTEVGDTPFLVDFVDSLALNFEQRATFDRVWRRPVLRLEARRLLAAETELLSGSAGGLVVSDRDRLWLRERVPARVADGLTVVPLVIRAQPLAADVGPEMAGGDGSSPRLVFTGNLGYFVNDDAIRWWLREVWPRLQKMSPEVGLTIAGARPKRGLRRAARMAAGDVELIASPQDLGAVLAAASVSIAPMRAGSGVPVKVLEAWACGVPVVASPWAAAGASGRHDVDLLIAESASEWCEAVTQLVDDSATAERLARAGRERVEIHHSAHAARAAIASALKRAGLPS